MRGRAGLLRQHAMGAIVFVLTLGLTSGALAVLHGLDAHPGAAGRARRADRGEHGRDGDPLRRAQDLGVRAAGALAAERSSRQSLQRMTVPGGYSKSRASSSVKPSLRQIALEGGLSTAG